MPVPDPFWLSEEHPSFFGQGEADGHVTLLIQELHIFNLQRKREKRR